MDSNKPLAQLKALEKLAGEKRLAADGWGDDWEILIAILMSARTTDKKTIPTAEKLFEKFTTLEKLSNASITEIEEIIRPVNFYKTKSKRIFDLSKILVKKYHEKIPQELDELITLPGVGRKTANVFLAAKGQASIGVDTHVTYISNYLGWTNSQKQEQIEADLEKIFPKRLWGKLNWVLVRFGQTYTSRTEKNRILDEIKKIK